MCYNEETQDSINVSLRRQAVPISRKEELSTNKKVYSCVKFICFSNQIVFNMDKFYWTSSNSSHRHRNHINIYKVMQYKCTSLIKSVQTVYSYLTSWSNVGYSFGGQWGLNSEFLELTPISL